MPFDPALPADGSELESDVMRAQFNALADLIAALLPSITAQVDNVTTLPAGDPAEVTVNFNGTTLGFTFAIPQGQDGPPGPDGPQGPEGPQGADGPAFATVVVDGVTTLNPGQPATVTATLDGNTVHLEFGIPRGEPGEVNTDQMDTAIAAAIAGTAQNPSSLSPLSLTISDPPTQAEVQAIVDAYNSLLTTLQR